jgi:tetratricopeptide (TPR) repeat protein
MKKRTVIYALASVITFGCVFFTGLPAQGGQPYAPWLGLKNNLEQAKSSSPDNYAVPYYLGLVYLREGNRNAAIQEWERYIGLAPEDFKSVSIRERLTILKLDQAAENARQAVGRDMKDQERQPVDNSLAVFNFKNLATAEYIPFIKALTMTIITDLSKVPQLVLVERIKVQALVEEMDLGTTGIVDPETATQAGGFLLAQHITWGEVGASQQDTVQITAKVGQTLSSSNPVDVHAEGAKEKFFELEKQIVFGIIEALGLTKEKLSSPVLKALERHHTQNFKAFMLFGKGLDHLDRKDFAEAKAAFEQAGKEDPNFGLSTTLEQATPKTALTVTAADMIDGVGEEAAGEEPSTAPPIETMAPSIVVETDNAAQEISDVAQNQQEVLTREGSITVHW